MSPDSRVGSDTSGESHLLGQLRALLEGLDDEALITLSSTGLLRRARKDLQSLTPVVSDSGPTSSPDFPLRELAESATGEPARAG
jgi:hypothetical protein